MPFDTKADREERFEEVTAQFPHPEETWEVEQNVMGQWSVWNERGDTLYFLSERCGFRCIWSQRLDVSTKQPLGPPAARTPANTKIAPTHEDLLLGNSSHVWSCR